MKNNGNPNQWEDRYPEASTVENDIKTGKLISQEAMNKRNLEWLNAM